MPRYIASITKGHWHEPLLVQGPWDLDCPSDDFESKQELDAIFSSGEDEPGEPESFLADTPWGDIIVCKCPYPDSPGEMWDIPTGMWCFKHRRTVYYCHEVKRVWCDGGPPDFEYHVFKLTAWPHFARDIQDGSHEGR